MIDDAASTYDVETLERFKCEAEEHARRELGRPVPATQGVEAIVMMTVDRYVEHLKKIREEVGERRRHSLEDFDRQVRVALAEYSNLLETGATTVEALLDEPDFQRIADNYSVEAQREALRERAGMLAYALAGTLCNRTLTLAQKSRVERVIRELDPPDVRLLYRLSQVSVPQFKNDAFDRDGMMRMKILEQYPSSKDILHAAGCVTWENNGGLDGGVFYSYITTIGESVLKVLEGYTRSSGAEPDPPSTSGSDAGH